MVVYEALNWMFGPVLKLPPLASIFVISLIIAVISTLAYKYLTDQAIMKETKESMKKMQQEMKNTKDKGKVADLQKQVMRLNLKYMSFSMKPMLVTLLPFILIFSWLRNTFGDTVIVNLPFSVPLIGPSLEWLGTYIIFSLVLTSALRKILKVS